MLDSFRILLILININQETVLNWFGIENYNSQNVNLSTNISIQTIYLIISGLWDKVQNGLSIDDIENILFFILFIRVVSFTKI